MLRHYLNQVFLFSLVFALNACGAREEAPKSLFTLLDPAKTHVLFSNDLSETEAFNIVEYLNYYNGAGVAAGDINNDGLIDLYFAANQLSNRLFINKGNLKFRDITESAGVACPGDWKTGVSMADVNGDGLLDIYVSQVGDYKTVQGENHLYINNGDETFTDRAKEFGLQFKGFSTQSLFFDYDNDGDLDMFLLNHAVHTRASYGQAAIVRYSRDLHMGDRLFEQVNKDGQPYFVNVTERSGIFSSRIGYGLGVAAGDINNDGFIDLYISNDFHENDYLYFNNGDGTFTEKIRMAIGHTSKSSMGNDMADFNNDGLLDIFSLDMLPEDETILKKSAGEELMEVFDMKEDLGYFYQLTRNCLQLNRGNGVFSEIALFSGVYATDWSWAPLFFDADNDGYKDLFVTNGIPNRPNDLDYLQFIEDHTDAINTLGEGRISNATLIEIMPSQPLANYAYKNNKDLTFTNLAAEWGLDKKGYSNGFVYADLDNDGDLDLVINNVNDNCSIYRNNAEMLTKNNFLKVRLKGNQGNLFGIGARVELFTTGQLQVQQLMPARGSMSSVDPVLNFGLGNVNTVDSLVVVWPGGKKQSLTEIKANTTVEVRNVDAKTPEKAKISNSPGLLFTDVTDSIQGHFTHTEYSFSDFVTQPLLPHKLSAQGPKMAVGDVNGDGLDDVYLCGGAGQAGALFVQIKDGDFVNVPQKSFESQSEGEEIDAELFDADGDGDLDLYIARGSTEFEAGSTLLQDLFYENDGRGNFKLLRTSNPPPAVYSSCVSVADFDQDGDQDIFVGGRPTLKNYGQSGQCQLLVNDGSGVFTDKANAMGSSFQYPGMVTDGLWVDIDTDGRPELAVVGEWMGIKIFEYENGKMDDIAERMGLAQHDGWWNTISAGDIDHDGDIDLVVGNLGQNAKITATPMQPAKLYVKDFDANGKTDPIISFYKNGESIPFATRDDIIAQIPSLKNKFPTYESYAGVRAVEEIFTPAQLADAKLHKAYEFRTCIINNIDGTTLQLVPLSKEAQLFPVFSILIHDFDHDGYDDLMLGGNLYRANITYGRYDAGYGLLLKSKGQMNFAPQTLAESGLQVRGEVRDMELVKTPGKALIFISKSASKWQVLKEN